MVDSILKVDKVVVGSIRTNCYIVQKNNACFIIDPGAEAEKIKDMVGHLVPKFILLSHGHYDHVLALRDLKVLYPKVDIYVSKKDQELVEHLSEQGKYIGQKITDIKMDMRTLSEGDLIPFFNERIKVIETPGHTFGSLCFAVDGYLFSGDTLFYHSYGRTDLPWSDSGLMKESLEKLASISDNVKVFPGHGRETTISEEKKQGVLKGIGV
jgi:glyoxylase-like metal-dependent hydrolase (beta-lactamase superfamily II)